MFLPFSLPRLWLRFSNGCIGLRRFSGADVAARRVRKITGATPAFVAVSRHKAFSSLLSSLRGSHLLPAAADIYVFVNQIMEVFMHIKPQVKIETVTLAVTGVEKRLVDGFRQRCEEMNGSAQGFIMNQILEEFLKSSVEKQTPKRKAAAIA
jgi:hypothetical protein